VSSVSDSFVRFVVDTGVSLFGFLGQLEGRDLTGFVRQHHVDVVAGSEASGVDLELDVLARAALESHVLLGDEVTIETELDRLGAFLVRRVRDVRRHGDILTDRGAAGRLEVANVEGFGCRNIVGVILSFVFVDRFFVDRRKVVFRLVVLGDVVFDLVVDRFFVDRFVDRFFVDRRDVLFDSLSSVTLSSISSSSVTLTLSRRRPR